MRGPTLRALAALLTLAPSALAFREADPMTVAPQSRLWIEGSSTMRKFTCKVGQFDAQVDAQAGAVSAVLAGQKAVRTVTITVPTARIDCGNGTMNEHMLKALEAKEHPQIEFRVVSYDVAARGEGVEGMLAGTLTLGGTTRPLSVPAQAREDAAGLRVTGSATVHMREFGLKPPTLMMGTLKVDERVTVGFDLILAN